MNISSLIPPVNTAKLTHPRRSENVVAGSRIDKDAPRRDMNEKEKRKHRGQERRKQKVKPMLDMRVSSDRREDLKRPSINVEV
jgi:hypothetical protein